MIAYTFLLAGEAADGQAFEVKGRVRVPREGMIVEAMQDAMMQGFSVVTDTATDGQRCVGPYRIFKFCIERVT